MKYLFSFAFSLFVFNIGLAQFNESAYNNLLMASYEVDQYFDLYGYSEEDLRNINGSPYQVDFFQPGTIYSNDKLAASNILMRYNIFSDEIEINQSQNPEEKDISVLSKSPTIFVNIANNTYVYVQNLISKDKSGYFNVLLEDDHFDLYKKSTTTYIEKRFAETTYQQDQPARFEGKETYFLVNTEGRFFELPSKRRKFLNVFKDHKNKMNSYIKKENLDFKDENDLVKIITHFNTLLKNKI